MKEREATGIDADGFRRLVGGDLGLMPALRATDRDELIRVAGSTPGVAVTVDAVVRVLEARQAGTVPTADAWRWAKLLLHKTHPYRPRPEGPKRAPGDLSGALKGLQAETAPEFDLLYSRGHDRVIADALGALYSDRGRDQPAHLAIGPERAEELIALVLGGDPPPTIVDIEDGHELVALAEETVFELHFWLDTFRLRIPLENDREWTIDVTDLTLDLDDRSAHLDISKSSPAELAPLLGLRGATIERCICRHAGLLEMTFADGTRLTAHPDPAYEGWEVRGPVHIVCMGGGELAIWDNDPRTKFRFDDFLPDEDPAGD